MGYAVQLGSRFHNWNDVQVRRNLELLANYRVYRYPTHKMGLLSHIFRVIALPFYTLRFNYTFGNNYYANQMLVQLRPRVGHDYRLALLFNRLAPDYHLDCLDLPAAPLVFLPKMNVPPYIPTPTYVAPYIHVPTPVIVQPPRPSFFSRIAPAFNFGGGRQIPGTEAVDVGYRRHHTPITQAVPLATRHVNFVAPAPMRQLPGTEAVTHSRPANAMMALASTPTRTQTLYTENTNTLNGRVAVGGGNRRR